MTKPDGKKRVRPHRKQKRRATDRLLDYLRAAKFLGIAEGTLRNWVSSELYGIPFVKLGGKVRFRPESLEKWIESRERGGAQFVSQASVQQVEAR